MDICNLLFTHFIIATQIYQKNVTSLCISVQRAVEKVLFNHKARKAGAKHTKAKDRY
jgi:hypothetical protein